MARFTKALLLRKNAQRKTTEKAAATSNVDTVGDRPEKSQEHTALFCLPTISWFCSAIKHTHFSHKLCMNILWSCCNLRKRTANVSSTTTYFNNVPAGGRYSKTFYTGRLRPEVQPLTLLYTIFSETVPLSYTFY